MAKTRQPGTESTHSHSTNFNDYNQHRVLYFLYCFIFCIVLTGQVPDEQESFVEFKATDGAEFTAQFGEVQAQKNDLKNQLKQCVLEINDHKKQLDQAQQVIKITKYERKM